MSSSKKSDVTTLLREILVGARRAPYYRSRIPEGIEEAPWEGLRSVPVTSQTEYKKAAAINPLYFQAEPGIGGLVLQTGGTSGDPKFAVYSQIEVQSMIDAGVDMLGTMGLERGHNVANCLAAGELYGGLLTLEHELQALGARSFPFGSFVRPEFFARVAQTFPIDAAFINPISFMPTLREVHKISPQLRIPRILYGGAALSEEDAGWLRQHLGVHSIRSAVASVDALQYGVQCDHCQGRTHHVMSHFNHVEILDDENQPVKAGQPGRIVITSLYRRSLPLIRYDIGDRGRWIDEPCPCGSTEPRFQFLGRAGDYVKLANNFFVFFDELVEPLMQHGASLIQLVLAPFAGGSRAIFRCESADMNGDRARLALYERWPLMQRHMQDGRLAVDMEVLAPGTLPRNPRTGKVPMIVDHRYEEQGIS